MSNLLPLVGQNRFQRFRHAGYHGHDKGIPHAEIAHSLRHTLGPSVQQNGIRASAVSLDRLPPGWYHAPMNRAKTTFRCFMLGFAMLSGLRVFASPADLAEDLAALVAEGRGVLMPNLDEAHVEYRGVQVLPGDFPADFLLGLVPIKEHGITVYPIAIRIDENSGNAIFYNANAASFYTDNDGMSDLWEIANGLFPTNALDAAENPDGDGLVNLHEYWAECDPWTVDGTSAIQSFMDALWPGYSLETIDFSQYPMLLNGNHP